MSIVGKTIAEVVDLDAEGLALKFTDGTCAQISGTGWEVDGATIEDDDFDLDQWRFNNDWTEAIYEDKRRFPPPPSTPGSLAWHIDQEIVAASQSFLLDLSRQTWRS